ncbi:MAG: hypothetical protein ACP5N2_01965 [Candidatus Nanoarchaeia archaeon]
MYNKKISLIIAFIILSLLYAELIVALQSVKDVSVEITLENISSNTSYSKFAKLTNNDDEYGVNDNLSLLVEINVTHDLETYFWNVSKTINSYSETGLGVLSITQGEYLLCVYATSINFEDPNLENNLACRELTTVTEFDIFVNDTYFNGSYINDSYFNESYINDSYLNESYINNSCFNNSYFNDSADDYFYFNESCFDDSDNNESYANDSDDEEFYTNGSNDNSSYFNDSYFDDFYNDSSYFNETELNLSEGQFNTSENLTTNNTNTNYFCECTLQIITAKQLFSVGEKLLFTLNDCSDGSKFNHSVEYWVEAAEGIVKQKMNTTSKLEKSYTPSFDAQEKYFLIKAKFKECANDSENLVEKLVVFVNAPEIKETYFEITLPEEEASDVIFVSVEGFKADTSKTLVSIWLEKSGKKYSQTTKFYVENKNSKFDVKIPLLLNVKESGDYDVVVEGLDEREEKEIKIIREKIDEEQEFVDFEQDLLKGSSLNQESQINSFYTLKRIFSENITVYVNIHKPENKSLKVYGDFDQKNILTLKEKNAVNISIKSATEILIAELYHDSELLDKKILYLNLTQQMLNETNHLANEEKSLSNFVDTSSDEKSPNLNVASVLISEELNTSGLTSSEFSPGENKITANVVVAPQIALKKSAVIFMIVSVIVCLILFHKKTRLFILKKTKFFK